MPHHHLNKPALGAALAGGVISCAALLFATAPANAQPLGPAAGPGRSAVGFADDANHDIVLAGLTPSVSGETGSISPSVSYARIPDASIFADGADRTFVLDNPMAEAVSLSGAIASPAASSFQNTSTDIVEYIFLGGALQDSGAFTGFAVIGGRMRDESDWRNAGDKLFAGANIQNPLSVQNVAALSYGFYEASLVYGENTRELSPLYYHPLTERLNLAFHTYIGYEDTSPGNSDPILYTGIGLTVSRETWPE